MSRRTVGLLAGLAVLASGLPALPAAADDSPSFAERESWTPDERSAYGRSLWPELPREEPLPATEVTGRPTASEPAEGTTDWAVAHPPRAASPVWPDAGDVVLDVPGAGAGARGRVGGLSVAVKAVGSAADAPGRQVRVQVLDRGTAEAAGVDGVLLAVSNAAKGSVSSAPGRVSVEVDVSGLVAGASADFASRLRLVELPACALTTPEKAECHAGTVIGGQQRSADGKALTGEVAIKGSASSGSADRVEAMAGSTVTVMAATADTSGGSGNWSATSLSASASWQVSAQTGSFSWSYPMRTPPTPGDLGPDVSLGYDSGSLDGRTAGTNNQTSVVGDGWELSASGFVERKYVSCSDDQAATSAGAANNATHKTGDLCWKSDNATLVLGGKSTDLIRASDGTWRGEDDDNTKVERLTGASNADNDKEYWKVTTADGTQYFFGQDARPSDSLALNSSWTVPVFGNHPGEPCYQATFAASRCQQTWRWNLDYVVDPLDNTMTYVYGRESNNYSYDLGAGVAAYNRGGYLDRIDYGQRKGAESGNAPARVDFVVKERCVVSDTACAEAQLTDANKANWPDVPFDLICSSSTSCPGDYSPSFFTRKRLTTVTTQALKADNTYRNVDRWTLAHTFPDPGDGDLSDAVLWLASVQHSGIAGGTQVDLDPTTFAGTQFANRVDTQLDGRPAMTRYRITSITSEAGGVTSVNYLGQDCSPTSLPASPETNTRRCLPAWWTPSGATNPVMEYFHKYVVDSIVESPQDTVSESVQTKYTYGSPAWRYTDDELTPEKYRTWAMWRGYGTVDVVTGATGTTQSKTRYRYFQGLDGGRLNAAGGTRAASVDGITDHDQFAGQVREQITYDGAAVVGRTLSWPWRSAATATADGKSAYHTGTEKTETVTTLTSGTRTTQTVTSFDSYGMPVTVDDKGDTAIGTDDRCTTTNYIRNTGLNLLETVERTETVGKACGVTASRPAEVISDQRFAYDGGAVGTTPTKGLVTETQEVKAYSSGTPTYVTTQAKTYDTYGRPLTVKDALNRTTTTAYTETAGLTTKTVVTTPDPDGAGTLTAHVSTTDIDPAFGAPVKVTDPNGKITSGLLDGMGRLTSVWEPGRVQGTDTATSKVAYTVSSTGINAVVTQKLNHDGSAYVTSSVIYDGLLRERQTQSRSADRDQLGRLVTDKIYDTRGLVKQANGAWYTTGTPGAGLLTTPATVPSRTLTTYDGAERATTEVFEVNNAEKWRTTTSYGGDRVTIDPPTGATPTTTITDARGNTTQLVQYLGASPGTSQTTAYQYDVAGRLAGMTDAAGNQWSYGYDLRGRQTSASDPDKGTGTTTYDDAGQVVTTTDARGEKLAYTYDALGRKLTMRDDTTSGTVRAQWAYDTLAKGQLTSSTRVDGTSSYVTAVTGYDHHYRPLGQSVTIPSTQGALAGTYSTNYTYTVDGRPQSTVYPAMANLGSETVATEFDAANQPFRFGSAAAGLYVAGAKYDTRGKTLISDLGANFPVVVNYAYETGTERLTTAKVVRNGTTGYDYNAAYGYDLAGNITKIADTPTVAGAASDVQCFEYDDLRRLAEAWTPSADDCSTAPSVAALGGAAKYWTGYAYDAVGNRTSTTQHAATNTVSTYAYPAAGATAVRPHAVTSVASVTGSTTATSTFAYDGAGNMVTRDVAGQTAQTMSWDAEGELDNVQENSTTTDDYVYTADGDRLVRKQDGKTTVYLPGGTELTLSGTTLTAQRYYAFGGKTVAVRTGKGLAGASTIVSDHQATAQLQVSQLDNTVRRQYSDPFGAPRGTAAAMTGDHGFLDKPTDTTGLTAIGARYYDPLIGRFISVDPIMDLKDPQQWNPYAYSNSNPVTWSDPTGMIYGGPMLDGKYGSTKGAKKDAVRKRFSVVESLNVDKRQTTSRTSVYQPSAKANIGPRFKTAAPKVRPPLFKPPTMPGAPKSFVTPPELPVADSPTTGGMTTEEQWEEAGNILGWASVATGALALAPTPAAPVFAAISIVTGWASAIIGCATAGWDTISCGIGIAGASFGLMGFGLRGLAGGLLTRDQKITAESMSYIAAEAYGILGRVGNASDRRRELPGW